MDVPTTPPPMPTAFLETISHWPAPAATRLLELRYILLHAAEASDAGPIAESLKWGEPAWRPMRPRQGTTLRAGWTAKSPDRFGLFVNCRTTLAETMQHLYPTDFTYEDSRALWLPPEGKMPTRAIAHLARLAFTYHRNPSP